MTEQVTPVRTYLIVGVVLLLLTAATYGASFVDLGTFQLIVALGIAVAKSALIVLYFMHARQSTGITRVVMVGGLLWLGLLIVGTMDDVVTRGWIPVPGK